MNDRIEKHSVTIGFIPLTDCASLVIAQEMGFFERHGLEVTLSREASWASIRDKVAYELLDAAHMLAPMPLASTLGIGGPAIPMVTAVSLGVNGNAITVSPDLYDAMLATSGSECEVPTGKDLASVVAADRLDGRAPITFGIVFPMSMHNYLLRYWLAASGIDPDHDVNLIVVPPPQMTERLQLGHIDGFCVGEPWNSAAESEGCGRTLLAGHELWRDAPEKVLGVTREWAEAYPGTHRALVAAVLEASRWLDEPHNRERAAGILSDARYVGVAEPLLCRSLCDAAFHSFFREHAAFPWRSHAMWLLTQMLRWGQVQHSIDLRGVAESVYRTDVFRDAAAAVRIAAPLEDYKREPAEVFMDRRAFDPGDPLGYLDGQGIARLRVPRHELAAINE